MHPKIILIHPPLTKPTEPPAGIAKLSSCLKANGIEHSVIDANLESILYLLKDTSSKNKSTNRWTARACKNRESNLAALQDVTTYQNISRYRRVVADTNHLLNVAGKCCGVDLSLADYRDLSLSPVKSTDLISAADKSQTNPFYPYFQHRLINALEENPDFIGFSLNYLSQALCTFAMIGFVKQIAPQQKIILGGSLITSWMKLGIHKKIFQGLVDEMVAGPGEEKLLKLLGVKKGLLNCPPDYSGFPLTEYFSTGVILPYSSASGCYWRKCAFCPEKAEGNAYLPLEASQVTEELGSLTKQMNPSLIHLLDSSMSPLLLSSLANTPPG
ncbi:MAG: radical SAM protein, partial [Deltaproteobacteria bacterium]